MFQNHQHSKCSLNVNKKVRNPSSCISAREKHVGMARAANCWAIHIYYLFFKTALKKEHYYFMDEETELHSCLWSLSKEVAKMQTHSCFAHCTMLSSTRVTVSNITLQLQESTIHNRSQQSFLYFQQYSSVKPDTEKKADSDSLISEGRQGYKEKPENVTGGFCPVLWLQYGSCYLRTLIPLPQSDFNIENSECKILI